MGAKKQIGFGIMSAALGLALIGGGTYAYFSDSEMTNNTVAAGTLDLSVNPTTIVDVVERKQGDSVILVFELHKEGTLDIETVLLATDYSVIDAEEDNSEDFGEHIQVTFLYNADKMDEVIFETTLADLKDMSPEAVGEHAFYPIFDEKGLPAGEEADDLVVKFTFLDNDEDQNQFQGDSLQLEWTFTAVQGVGEEK